MPTQRSALLMCLILLVGASVVTTAQQPVNPHQNAPDSSGTTIKVTSRLTLVDVTATDSKDKPVHGLTQPDFTVKEDDKTQPIKTFEEFGTERPAVQAAPQLPPDIYTNVQPPAPTTSAVNVLMFDDVATGLARGSQTGPMFRMYSKQQAIKYLKTMHAGTRIAILELSNSLRVVQDFTSDQSVLLAAIDSMPYKQAHGAGFSSPPTILQEACALANAESELTVNALEGVAAFLSGIEGRKNLIWFTPGIPWLTNYPEFMRVYCLHDYTPELQRDYGLLTEAQVSLYPVDPRGLEACPMGGSGPTLCTPWMAALFEDHNSMQEMAKATGGQAYYNRNDLDTALDEAITTGSDYYSLSYVPPLSKYDGQYHKIDVKVDRPGVHLQYRDGYTAIDLTKPPKEAKKNAEKTATQPEDALHVSMGHGAAPSTQLLFAVRVTPSTAPAKPGTPPVIGKPTAALRGKLLVRYDFQYALRPDQITLQSEADGKREGKIDFVMIAYDGEGKPLCVMTEKVSFAVRMDRLEQFLQNPVRLPLQFDLPEGHIFVRVGVRDAPSGNVGTLGIPVTVEKPQKIEPVH